MKLQVNATAVLAIVGVGVAGFVVWKLSRAGGQAVAAVADTAKRVVTQDINPASDRNVINRAVTAVGQAATGDTSWSLGSWLYDKIHGDTPRIDAPTVANTRPGQGAPADTARIYTAGIYTTDPMPDSPSWADLAGMPAGFPMP